MIIVALLESQFYSMNSSCISGDVRNEIINFIPPFLTLVELRELTNRCLSLCTIRSLPWPAARLWTYSVHYMCPFIGDFHTAAAAVGKTAAVQCVLCGTGRGEREPISISPCPLRRHVVLNQTFSARERASRDGAGLEVQRFSSTRSPCMVMFLCASCEGLLGQ